MTFKCNRLRIDIDCSAAGTWCELDAIKIVGNKYLLRKLLYKHNSSYTTCKLYLSHCHDVVYIAEPRPNTLTSDFAKLINNADFSDVTFLVEGQKVHAHKAILMVRSDYFNAMFSNGMQESSKVDLELS